MGIESLSQHDDSLELVTLSSTKPYDNDVLRDLFLIERDAWRTSGSSLEACEEKIRLRVETFPEGVTLAGLPLTVVGCGTFLEAVGSQYAFRFHWNGNLSELGSWERNTAHGWTNKIHSENGETGFLVGVGVLPRFRGKKYTHIHRWQQPMRASELLIAQTLDNLFRLGVKRVIANARIPGYCARPDLSVRKYCALRRSDGLLVDPVLRFHERMGAVILKPIAYSMDDAESRNGGCWVLYTHPFVG